ncbi:MAG: hypothetical protein ACI9P5_002830 [Saprospiraceae bacterium]|jgi:hypothetical protein|tara:strand:+ start:1068 stop:1586 length:519 start_codon:yes stop_codon:yes gene_type:complete
MSNTKLLVPLLIGLAAGGALGYFVCSQSGGPTDLHSSSLISNSEAISMIDSRRAQSPNDPFSGHLEIGALLSYIHNVQERCNVIGAEFSGLEYYFANHSDSRPSSWNEGSLTTVIYPTYKSGGNHIPFDPYLSSETSKISVLDIKANLTLHGSSAHVLNRANMSPPKQPHTY